MQVFDGQTADGSSTEFKNLTGTTGHVNIYLSGNLGGGAVTVEAELPDESGWVPLFDGALESTGLYVIETTYFVGRLSLSGSSGASVSAWVEGENVTLKTRVLGA